MIVGVILIIIAATILFFVFKGIVLKGGAKPLIWWIATSAAVGFTTGFAKDIIYDFLYYTGIGRIYHFFLLVVTFIFSGFVGLLTLGLMNGLIFKKWGVRLSTPDED